MAAKLRLLLLDANVVLELHRVGLWGQVIERCDLLLARTVMEESIFYEGEEGKVYLDLESAEADRLFEPIDVDVAEIQRFRSRFTGSFLEKMDAGEQEALAYLVEVNQSCMISSADAVVWRTLGLLAMGEQGVSLEELLAQLGLGRKVDWPFSKEFRKKNTQKGFEERLYGGSLR